MENNQTIKKTNVFKNRNYLLLFQGTLTSNIAATLYSFALSFYILKITNNNSVIQGAYLAMCGVTFVLFSFIGGIIADRFNKIKIIYGLDFMKGILILLCIIPLFFFINNENMIGQIVVIFVIGFLNNVIASIFTPASQAVIPELVEQNQLQQANSYFSVLNSFVSIVGILLAGILYSFLPLLWLFAIVGICYILSGVSEIFIKTKYKLEPSKLTLKVVFSDFIDGFKYLWPIKEIVYLILGILFINFFFTPINGNVIPYLINTEIAPQNYMFKNILAPTMWSSIIGIAFSIGSIIMGIAIGQMKPKEKYGKWIKIWLILMGFVFACLVLDYYLFIKVNINVFLIIMITIFFITGIVIICINVPIYTVIQKRIEPAKQAKVWSLINIGSQGLCPIASLTAGIIIGQFNIGILLIICAIGFLLTAILLSFSRKVNEI